MRSRLASEIERGGIYFSDGPENAARSADYVSKARRKCVVKPDAEGRITFGSPWLLGPASYEKEYLRQLEKDAASDDCAFALRLGPPGAAQPGRISITGVGEDNVLRWFWEFADDTFKLLEGERAHRVPLDQMGEGGWPKTAKTPYVDIAELALAADRQDHMLPRQSTA